MIGTLLAAAVAATQPVLHYVRSNSDGSEQERVVVFAERPDRVRVFKGRDRCTSAAYVTAELDQATGQALSLVGGRATRALVQQPQAWLTTPQGHVQVRVGSPEATPLFDVAVKGPWFIYDFDFGDWIAHPPAEILAQRDFGREMLLLLTPEDSGPTLTDRGRLELAYGGRGSADGAEFLYYRAGGPALGGAEGQMWFDAGDGRLIAARLPLANHAEYRDFAYRLVKRGDGLGDWEQVLADHWRGCPPPLVR